MSRAARYAKDNDRLDAWMLGCLDAWMLGCLNVYLDTFFPGC